MTSDDIALIGSARSVHGEFGLRRDYSAGTVAAALRTQAGHIYTGICIDLACGLGFCAEAAAVAEMLKHRETHIDTVVAVGRGGVILAPCGRCREMIWQVDRRNADCRVLLCGDREVRLKELLPDHWLEQKELA